MIGRLRIWKTKDGTVNVWPDQNVLLRYLHGGDYALGKHQGAKGSSGGKKKGKGKKKLKYPPAGGWKGGAPESNMGFSGPQRAD